MLFFLIYRHTCSKKSIEDTQLLVTAYDFNNHFLAIPHKTVANLIFSVPALLCMFVEKLFM